jgi:hypothetical protein
MGGTKVKTRTILTILAVMLILLPPLALGDEKQASGIPSAAQNAFESMKKLAGEWEGEAGEEKVHAVYRVTGAGSALMETLLPGTPHEMVSMYHMNGADLVMTHYCAAGNQPHLKFDPAASKPDRLVFKFVSGSNMDPNKDGHIHGVVFRLVDADHLEGDWEHYKDGKPGEGMKFAVTRKK